MSEIRNEIVRTHLVNIIRMRFKSKRFVCGIKFAVNRIYERVIITQPRKSDAPKQKICKIPVSIDFIFLCVCMCVCNNKKIVSKSLMCAFAHR